MPIHIYGSGGASSDEGILIENYDEHEVSFARSDDTITLTFPLVVDGTVTISALAIKKMRIGESESGTSTDKYRWSFSGVLSGDASAWCLADIYNGEGVYSGSVPISYTHDGKKLTVTITDSKTIGTMGEDTVYFNDFNADLFFTIG